MRTHRHGRQPSAVIAALCSALAACGGGGSGGGSGAAPQHTEYHGIAVADLDGDGTNDIVAARVLDDGVNPLQGAIDVFRGNPASAGQYLPRISYPIAAQPYAITVADMNLDGHPDVIVSCTFAETGFRLLLQDGAGGGVLLPGSFTATPDHVYRTAVADVDLDGLPDVVAGMNTELALVTQQTAAPGTFNAAVTIGRGSRHVIAADLNADGLIDVAAPRDIPNASNAVIYYLQDAAMPGTFEPSRSMSASDSNFSAAQDVASGVLDAQPGIDLAVAGVRVDEVGTRRDVYAVWSRLLQTTGNSGTFTHGGRYQLGFAYETLIAVGDLNADGRDDVAVAARTRTSKNHNFVAVSLQNASGTFPQTSGRFLNIPAELVGTAPALYTVAIADLNGDGRPDIVVSNNAILYFPQRSDAAGEFGPAVAVAYQ